MRTTMDLPENLLEDARRACGAATKREAVIAGLQELIVKAKREELRALAGKLALDVDLQRSRKGRR